VARGTPWSHHSSTIEKSRHRVLGWVTTAHASSRGPVPGRTSSTRRSPWGKLRSETTDRAYGAEAQAPVEMQAAGGRPPEASEQDVMPEKC